LEKTVTLVSGRQNFKSASTKRDGADFYIYRLKVTFRSGTDFDPGILACNP